MRAAVALLLFAGIAHASPGEEAREPRRWHLGIEGMTDFPLTVGVQVWAELPHRIRLTMAAGDLPDGYLQTINAVAVAAGAYNQQQADLITELLDRAATWRIRLGWRPFPRRGAYFEGGFGIVTLEKAVALADVIELASGLTAPAEARIGLGYDATTVVETLGAEVGWMWFPWRGLSVRVSLAFTAAVGAQVSITPNFASTVQRPFTQQAERYAADLIEDHFLIPTVGVALGWRIF